MFDKEPNYNLIRFMDYKHADEAIDLIQKLL